MATPALTALHSACQHDQLTDVQALVTDLSPQQITQHLTATNTHGRSAVHVAARYGATAVLEYLLAHVDQSAIHAADANGRTPLHLAMQFAQAATAEQLLTAGANPLASSAERETCAFLAACSTDEMRAIACLQLLQEHIAAEQDWQALLGLRTTDGRLAQHEAARRGWQAFLDQLLAAGLEVDATDHGGYSALHFACRYNHAALAIRLIADYNASPTRLTINGHDASTLALGSGYADLYLSLERRAIDQWLAPLGLEPEFEATLNTSINALLDHHVAYHQQQTALTTATARRPLANAEQAVIDAYHETVAAQQARLGAIDGERIHRCRALLQETEFTAPAVAAFALLTLSTMLLQKQQHKQAMLYAIAARRYYTRQVPQDQHDPGFIERCWQRCDAILIHYRQTQLRNTSALPRLHLRSRLAAIQQHRDSIHAQLTNSDHNIQALLAENTDYFVDLSAKLVELTHDLLLNPERQQAPPDRHEYAVMGLGSMARGEMSFYSDLEYAIVFDDDLKADRLSELRQYFSRHSAMLELVVIALGETPAPIPEFQQTYSPTITGFHCDEGGNTPLGIGGDAMTQLMGTVSQLAYRQINNESVITRNVLRTVTAITGNPQLVERYQQAVQSHLSKPLRKRKGPLKIRTRWQQRRRHIEAITCLSTDEFSPEKLAEDKLKKHIFNFNVKTELYRLPSMAVNNLALYYDIQARGVLEQINALCAKKVISSTAAEHLTALMQRVFYWRLRVQYHYGTERESLYHTGMTPPVTDPRDPAVFQLTETDVDDIIALYRTLIPLENTIQAWLSASENEFTEITDNPFATAPLLDDRQLTQVNAIARLNLSDRARTDYLLALELHPRDYVLHKDYCVFEHQQVQRLQHEHAEHLRIVLGDSALASPEQRSWLGQLVQSLVTLEAPISTYQQALSSLPASWRSMFIAQLEHRTAGHNQTVLARLRTDEEDHRNACIRYFQQQLDSHDTLLRTTLEGASTLAELIPAHQSLIATCTNPVVRQLLLHNTLICASRFEEAHLTLLTAAEQRLETAMAALVNALPQAHQLINAEQRQQAIGTYVEVYQLLPPFLRQGCRQALLSMRFV